MKKTSILIITLIFLTAGCNFMNTPKLEDYTWEVYSLQGISDSEAESEFLEAAAKSELICTAKNGVLTFTDQATNKAYTGTYKLKARDLRASNYEVAIDGKAGLATVAMTTYYDGSQDPTFIINFGDFTVNLYAEKTEQNN